MILAAFCSGSGSPTFLTGIVPVGMLAGGTCINGYSTANPPPYPEGYSLALPTAGTLGNLTVGVYELTPTPSFQIDTQVAVNFIGTNLACKITLTNVGQFTCRDSLDTVTVNAGDLVSLIISSPSPLATTATPIVSVSFEKQ